MTNFIRRICKFFLQQNVFAIHLESMTQRITEPVMSRMELAYAKIREYREPIVKNVQMDKIGRMRKETKGVDGGTGRTA